MGKVSYHFFICLFNAVFVYILLINYLGWSGGYIDVLGASTTADWTNSYFGFTSLRMMLDDFNNNLTLNGSFSLNSLYEAMTNLLDSITFGIPRLIAWMQGGKWNALDIFHLVSNLFFQPVYLFVYSFQVIGILVWYVFVILGILLKAFSGTYNVEWVNPISWSDVVSEYNSIRIFGTWSSNWVAPFLAFRV